MSSLGRQGFSQFNPALQFLRPGIDDFEFPGLGPRFPVSVDIDGPDPLGQTGLLRHMALHILQTHQIALLHDRADSLGAKPRAAYALDFFATTLAYHAHISPTKRRLR